MPLSKKKNNERTHHSRTRASTRIDHKRFIPAVLIGVWRFSAMDILDVDAHRITPGFLRSELTKWVDALPLKVNKPLYYHGVPDTKLSLTGRPRGLGARSHPTFNLTLTAVRIASRSSRHFSVAGTMTKNAADTQLISSITTTPLRRRWTTT